MVIRNEPWGAIRQLQDEMNRVFGGIGSTDDASNIATSRWMPAVDIKEEDTRFVLQADVPGVEPDAIDITMENGMLTIKGERQFVQNGEGDNGYRRVERQYGAFHRRFSLPDTADSERISARTVNGVLHVEIPKKEVMQPRRIQVTS